MKKIILIMLLILISGCSYFVPIHDNNEILLLTKLQTETKLVKSNCNNIDKQLMNKLVHTSIHLTTYTKYQTNNERTHQIMLIIDKNVQELNQQFTKQDVPFKIYCQLKTENIIKMTNSALESSMNKFQGE